jgi:hypothetical protein
VHFKNKHDLLNSNYNQRAGECHPKLLHSASIPEFPEVQNLRDATICTLENIELPDIFFFLLRQGKTLSGTNRVKVTEALEENDPFSTGSPII